MSDTPHDDLVAIMKTDQDRLPRGRCRQPPFLPPIVGPVARTARLRMRRVTERNSAPDEASLTPLPPWPSVYRLSGNPYGPGTATGFDLTVDSATSRADSAISGSSS